MTLISRITLERVELNGAIASKGEPLEYYSQTLGDPDRWIMPGDPPPYGHRNNVIHFYDRFGILLREHHATRLISSIEFEFDTSASIFPTESAYLGYLDVCGVNVRAEMPFAEFAETCEHEFTPHLGHAYFLDGEKISIQFEVRPKGAKGKRKQEIITELAVGFRGAHKQQ